MHALTDIPEAPWWVVKADDKRRARLDCIRHLLTQFDYEDVTARDLELPERQKHTDYRRRPVPEDKIVPENYRDPPQ
jgi:hypothetical protein